MLLPARLRRAWKATLLRGGRADGVPASALHSQVLADPEGGGERQVRSAILDRGNRQQDKSDFKDSSRKSRSPRDSSIHEHPHLWLFLVPSLLEHFFWVDLFSLVFSFLNLSF